MLKKSGVYLLAICSTAALAAPASARTASFVALGSETRAPAGFREMCERAPQWCQTGPQRVAPSASNAARAATTLAPMALALAPDRPDLRELTPTGTLASVRAYPRAAQPVASCREEASCGEIALPASPFPDAQVAAKEDIALLASAAPAQPRLGTQPATHLDWLLNVTAADIAAALPRPLSPPAAPEAAPASIGAGELGALVTLRNASRDRPAPEPRTEAQAAQPASGLAALGDAKAVRTLLKAINHRVNGRVFQRTDQEIYGVGEFWTRPGTERGAQGDCEDLALEKRLELIAAGFPPERLAFGVVFIPRLGLHTVLIARTEQGDAVLDSRTPHLTSWEDTGYIWLAMQSWEDPMRWHSVKSARS